MSFTDKIQQIIIFVIIIAVGIYIITLQGEPLILYVVIGGVFVIGGIVGFLKSL